MSEELVGYTTERERMEKESTDPKNLIVKYVRHRGRMVGCVIAVKFPEIGTVVVTGSLCRVKKDVFSKNDGLNIALERAKKMAFEEKDCEVAFSLQKDIEYMDARARRYFTDVKSFVVSSIKPNPQGKHYDLICLLEKATARANSNPLMFGPKPRHLINQEIERSMMLDQRGVVKQISFKELFDGAEKTEAFKNEMRVLEFTESEEFQKMKTEEAEKLMEELNNKEGETK